MAAALTPEAARDIVRSCGVLESGRVPLTEREKALRTEALAYLRAHPVQP